MFFLFSVDVKHTSLQLQVYYVVRQLVIQNFQYKKQLEVLLELHQDKVYERTSRLIKSNRMHKKNNTRKVSLL
jgi:hypothetical protein